ncbi:sigma-54-dependent transcriptional regulator [Bacteroidota bacterium]
MLLQFEFGKVKTLSSPNQIITELRVEDYDIVLLDMNFSAGINTGNEGLYWLSEIKKATPTVEVIMITAYGDVELAVKAIKKGAAEFILKPWENVKLIATITSVLKLRKSNLKVDCLEKREKSLKEQLKPKHRKIVGTSQPILNMLRIIQKVSKTDANVLITGENGTGKELVAQELHYRSNRNSELLVTVDMGAIPDTLFESELFGHVKGAFTDAKESKPGKFILAHKGTLFLDEIGNLSLPLQSKLLVALENRTIIPVGGHKPTNIDIRLISATNYNLEERVNNHEFREDLLYRLNTIKIEVPPLRERGNDIELLANFFLNCFKNKYQKSSLRINSQAIKKLEKYPWPGNVRELQHTIEKAVILADSDTLTTDDFVFKQKIKPYVDTQQTLEDMEKQLIEDTLSRHNGNLSSAASQLGISRQTLYNKIERYDI